MDPSVPSASPRSSGGQLNGAKEREAVSIMPKAKEVTNSSPTPFADSPTPTDTIAAAKAVRVTVEAMRM
jgi:hypothetical protein